MEANAVSIDQPVSLSSLHPVFIVTVRRSDVSLDLVASTHILVSPGNIHGPLWL